jgi:hypothetical protein
MADDNSKVGERDELNSSSEDLNSSTEEVEKEMTEEEANNAREERRRRREQLRQLVLDPSILDEPDEPSSPHRTRSASSAEGMKEQMEVEQQEQPTEKPAEQVVQVEQAEQPVEPAAQQSAKKSSFCANKVCINHIVAKDGANPSGASSSFAVFVSNPIGSGSNRNSDPALKGQPETVNRAYRAVAALKVLTNEKKGGLRIISFDRSPFKLFSRKFSKESVQAPSCERHKTTQRTLFLLFANNY